MSETMEATTPLAVRDTRCPSCGEGTILPRSAHGQAIPFRDEAEVLIAREVIVPLCDVCGEMRLSVADAERLDEALDEAYRAKRLEQQRREISHALSALRVDQTQLEAILGLSSGYISKMLTGRKTTSATVVRFLHVLSAHPTESLRALADITPAAQRVLEASRP